MSNYLSMPLPPRQIALKAPSKWKSMEIRKSYTLVPQDGKAQLIPLLGFEVAARAFMREFIVDEFLKLGDTSPYHFHDLNSREKSKLREEALLRFDLYPDRLKVAGSTETPWSVRLVFPIEEEDQLIPNKRYDAELSYYEKQKLQQEKAEEAYRKDLAAYEERIKKMPDIGKLDNFDPFTVATWLSRQGDYTVLRNHAVPATRVIR